MNLAFWKNPLSLLAVALLSASCASSGSFSGAPTLPPHQAPPDIFSNYRPDGNSSMASGWTRTMDMSGVSWNDSRTVTLITPRHVVMAKHYPRPAGSPVVFHDRSGKSIKRKLIGFAPALGDVMVGLLNEPVTSNYTPYPLPSPSTDIAKLPGRRVIVSDQHRKLFVHKIRTVGNRQISFKQDEEDLYGWGKNLVVGDSGNPSFLIVGNQLVLIETHTTGGPGAGPYYGDPNVQGTIRSAVSKLDPSSKIRTVTIP